MAKGRLKSILNRTLLEESDLTQKQLRSDYNYLRKVIRSRQKSFEKRGHSDLFSKSFAQGFRSLKTIKSRGQLLAEMARMENYLLSSRSTVEGALTYQEQENKRRQSLSETLNRDLSEEEFNNIGEFLGQMQDRLKEVWKTVSDRAVKLFEEAQRLNLDPGQFLRNYDYWIEHAEELEGARPLNYDYVKPSSYIEQLRLPSISKWREDR